MSHPAISLRHARPDDSAKLQAILQSTYEDTWLPRLSPEAIAERQDTRSLNEYVARIGQDALLAEIDGEVLGMIYWNGDFIDAVHVLRAGRRRGIAGVLMDAAEDAMRKAGVQRARLETDTFNTGSQAFYLARGYVEMDRYPDLEWNSGFTTILYEKAL